MGKVEHLKKYSTVIYFFEEVSPNICSVPAGFYRAEGMIKNVNTIEEYKALCADRQPFLQQAGRTVSSQSRCSFLSTVGSEYLTC